MKIKYTQTHSALLVQRIIRLISHALSLQVLKLPDPAKFMTTIVINSVYWSDKLLQGSLSSIMYKFCL